MTKQNVCYLIGGLVAGTAAGVLGTRAYFKKKYERKADEEIAEMEAYYHKKNEYDESISDCYGGEDQSTINKRPNGPLSDEERAEIKEKLKRNYEGTTNYASIYREKKTEEDIPIATEQNLTENVEQTEAEMATENHQKNTIRSPRIISEDDLGDLPGYIEQESLFYYTLSDVLADEEDALVDDPEYLIGNALDKFNFRESNEKIIFVMNYELDTVYEINKIEAEYDFEKD